MKMNIRTQRATVAAATLLVAGMALSACSSANGGAAASSAPDILSSGVSIVAPSGPGSGYDQTARAIEQSLKGEDLVSRVQVSDVEGAGGTVALADFVTKSDPSELMIAGLSLVGAVITNSSPNSLSELTPVARLIGEYDVIVVPASSPYKTLQDFFDGVAADPGKNPIAIGNQGGYDHMWGATLVQAAGVNPIDVNFVTFNGGGEALIALLGNQVSAGISGYGEFAGSIETGELRILATASAEPLGIAPDAPTIADAGYPDAAMVNWRGIFAPPGISADDLATLESVFSDLVASESWKATLETNGWSNEYLTSAEFARELDKVTSTTESILKDLGLV